MPKQALRYVAITRAKDGWYVELIGEPGEGRAEVERLARERITRDSTDPQTAMASLGIMAYSAAIRAFAHEVRTYEAALRWAARRYGGEGTT